MHTFIGYLPWFVTYIHFIILGHSCLWAVLTCLVRKTSYQKHEMSGDDKRASYLLNIESEIILQVFILTCLKLYICFSPPGSATLHHWQQLAQPHLGVILDARPGVVPKGYRPLELELEQVCVFVCESIFTVRSCSVKCIPVFCICNMFTDYVSM